MYVVEDHQNGSGHTHIVYMAKEERLWTVKEQMDEFPAEHPNLKRLRKSDDIYRAMAYCGKQYIPNLWCNSGVRPRHIYTHVVSALWDYALKAHSPEYRRKFLAQYQNLNKVWLGAVGPDPYDQSNVVSEDASHFFE